MERAALEKEKVENRRISREVIEENRKKGEALQTELVKVRSLEEELLANIRIVEMRLKEKVNAPKEPVQAQPDNRIGVTNNWLQEDGKEKLNKSVGNKLKSQKREQGAPVRRIPETKGSYMPDPKNNKFDL